MCFTCNEKYTWNHTCPNARLMCLFVDDESSEEDNLPPKFDTYGDEPWVEEEVRELQLLKKETLHTLNSQDKGKALRFHGQVGQEWLLFLVDSGATLNFIAEPVAQAL